MVEKIFRILSDSEEYLTSDIVARALLKQITLNPTEPDVNFIVMEIANTNNDYKNFEN